jgi:hypothetical protein
LRYLVSRVFELIGGVAHNRGITIVANAQL